MNTSRWEIFRNNMHYEFRLVSGNGKVLMKSENEYVDPGNARAAIQVIQNLTRQTLNVIPCHAE